MKDYRQLIKELPSRTIVCAFGEFNPPTIGHELLVKTVNKLAEQRNSDHVIFTSPSKNNSLVEEKKSQYLKLMFPKTKFKLSESKISSIKSLSERYKNIVVVTGSEQSTDLKKVLKEYTSIEVVSIAEKDPDALDTKMKSYATKGIYEEFKKKLPSTIRELDARRLMNDLRETMGLDSVKEQIVLVKDKLRDDYFRGEVFNVGDIVESDGVKYTIAKRGSNHLLLKESSGALVSKWIYDVQPTEEKEMNEDLTDKTIKVNDKIKVARIIATMLGVDNAETSSNPENLVNSALRKVRSKTLNPESLNIITKMMRLAAEVGIEYDNNLVPTKIKEGTVQPNGTSQIDTPVDAPKVIKKIEKKAKAQDKSPITFTDFTKNIYTKEVEPEPVGPETQADTGKQNDSDIDADFDTKEMDKKEVGHTLVSPGGQDNLRRRKVKYHLGEQKGPYEMEGGHENTAQHVMTSSPKEHGAKQKKLAKSFLDRMQSMSESGELSEVSSALLDRYKAGAKKSADELTAKGEHKKSADRWMNVMKATGKQMDKTTAGIKKALNKEEYLDEADVNDKAMTKQELADKKNKGGFKGFVLANLQRKVAEGVEKTPTGVVHKKDDWEGYPSTFKKKDDNKLLPSSGRHRMNKVIPPNDKLKEENVEEGVIQFPKTKDDHPRDITAADVENAWALKHHAKNKDDKISYQHNGVTIHHPDGKHTFILGGHKPLFDRDSKGKLAWKKDPKGATTAYALPTRSANKNNVVSLKKEEVELTESHAELSKHISDFSKGVKSSSAKQSTYKRDNKPIHNMKHVETDSDHHEVFKHLQKMGYKKTSGYDPKPHEFSMSHNHDSMTTKSDPVHHASGISAHIEKEHGGKTKVHFMHRNIKEDLDEGQTDDWKNIQSMDKGSVTGDKSAIKKRLAYLNAVHAHHKKHGNDTLKVRKEIEGINRSRITESDLQERADREDDEYHVPDRVTHKHAFTVSHPEKFEGKPHRREVTTNNSTRSHAEVMPSARKHLENQGYKIHEQVDLDELKKKIECPTCVDGKCQCPPDEKEKALDTTQINTPFDPFFEEADAPEENELDALTDKDIDQMIDKLADDDYLEAYEEDELALVDDETGEEIPKHPDEDKLSEDALLEVMSRTERMKAKFRLRRTASKRQRATKIALKRYSSTETVNKRARRLAIMLMKKRMLRGRNPSQVSVGEKERIERAISKRKAIIGRIASKLVSRVRKVEKARMSHTKFTQGGASVQF